MRHLIGILSADKKSIQRVDQLRQQYGNEPKNWLPYFIKKEHVV